MAHSLRRVYLCKFLSKSLSNIESGHVYNLTRCPKKREDEKFLFQTWCYVIDFFHREPRETIVNKTCLACHLECLHMNGTATCSAPVCVSPITRPSLQTSSVVKRLWMPLINVMFLCQSLGIKCGAKQTSSTKSIFRESALIS